MIASRATIGGLSGVHQFARIGRGAMVGAMSLVLADVLPHTVALGTPARHSGVNRVGLLRVGVDEKRVAMLETALRLLARGESLDTLDSPELDDLRAALRSPSMRGISPSRGG